MVDIEVLHQEIVERLKPLDPDKIILFGSYAYGTPTADSDLDNVEAPLMADFEEVFRNLGRRRAGVAGGKRYACLKGTPGNGLVTQKEQFFAWRVCQ